MLKNIQRCSTAAGLVWVAGVLSAAASPVAFAACSAKKEHIEPAVPSYGGEQAALFSDLFRPELFGIDPASAAENDTLLVDRGRHADFVGPVRVRTMTRETRGAARNYTIEVEATGAPMRGTPRADAVALTVVEGSPAFAWLEGVGDKWVGTRLLLLLRYYEDGPHFFGTTDTPQVRAALASSLAAPRQQ
jgi:hypothetical protein